MIKYPYSQEREYQRFVKQVFTACTSFVHGSVFPKLSGWILVRKDEEPEEETQESSEIEALIIAILLLSRVSLYGRSQIVNFAKSISSMTAKEVQDYISKTYGIKIPYFEKKAKLLDWVSAQVSAVNNRVEKYVNDVDATVRDGLSKQKTKLAIESEVKNLSEKLILASGAISGNGTGNLMAETERGMLEDANIHKYAWITQKDGRVRPEHAARQGKIFDWNKPPSDGHPGQPFLCRCVAAPVIEVGDKVEISISPRNAYDLTIYRKGVMPEQRPERDKKYAAILRSGKMTSQEIKQLALDPNAATQIYQNIITSGRLSASDMLKKGAK